MGLKQNKNTKKPKNSSAEIKTHHLKLEASTAFSTDTIPSDSLSTAKYHLIRHHIQPDLLPEHSHK